MTTGEFYYLLLVLGAFGSFALAMALATIRYKAWRRQVEADRSASQQAEQSPVPAPLRRAA